MADDDHDALPAESGARGSGPIVKRRPSGNEPALDPYRDIGGYPDDAGAEAGFDLRNILRIAWKRKWVIGGSLAGFLVCGLLWTLTQKPLYTATIRLEIGRHSPQILKGGDAAQSEVDDSGFETELELLKNSSLAQRVASMTHAAGDLAAARRPARMLAAEPPAATRPSGRARPRTPFSAASP